MEALFFHWYFSSKKIIIKKPATLLITFFYWGICYFAQKTDFFHWETRKIRYFSIGKSSILPIETCFF
jgi:hypothetical protein